MRVCQTKKDLTGFRFPNSHTDEEDTRGRKGLNMRHRHILTAVAVFFLILVTAMPATEAYILIGDVLNTAGGRASSVSYQLGYSVGQTVVGLSQGETYSEWAGFWGGTSWGQATLTPRESRTAMPQNFLLHQNYPNPFNPRTHISYRLPEACRVFLYIYNVKGQLVNRLLDQYQMSGEHTITWDGRDGSGIPVASGVYFYRLTAGSFQSVRKMLLLK